MVQHLLDVIRGNRMQRQVADKGEHVGRQATLDPLQVEGRPVALLRPDPFQCNRLEDTGVLAGQLRRPLTRRRADAGSDLAPGSRCRYQPLRRTTHHSPIGRLTALDAFRPVTDDSRVFCRHADSPDFQFRFNGP